MTLRYVTTTKFRELTGLSYNQVRNRISDGRLKWAKEGRWYMIDIDDYYARLEAQRKVVTLRPLPKLPPGGLTAHCNNELQRLRVGRLPARAMVVNV